MYKIYKYLMMSALFASCALHADEIQQEKVAFTVQGTELQHKKVSLLLAIVGNVNQEFQDIISIIKNDLEFSGQFTVATQQFTSLFTKKDIIALFDKGYSFALFLNPSEDGKGIEWRVYEKAPSWIAEQGVDMIKGAKYAKRGQLLRGWAHNVSDSLWNVLTGQEGFFSTKIAYCKDVNSPKKKKVKHVVVADYDGSNEQQLVSMPTVSVAPRWNNDVHNPLLFYSEYTNSNVRLIAVNMEKKRKIASNFDGINMLPTFSPDGTKVVYCLSKGKGNCQLYYYEKGALKQLTKNEGNNVSPTFSHDGNKLFFCSDFQTGQPQIYCYDIPQDKLVRLTTSGYCASPNYNPKQHKVVYSKIIDGVMQLFLYDVKRNDHRQLTYDAGHKEEASWSPCGNFLLFSIEKKDKSKIALLNIVTSERKYLTTEKYVCTYPAWSPTYEQFPVVV